MHVGLAFFMNLQQRQVQPLSNHIALGVTAMANMHVPWLALACLVFDLQVLSC
jgi:hypothetical protein